MGNLYFYLAFIFSIIFIIKLVFTRQKQKNLPPSPFALPIIGHLHLIKQPQSLYQSLGTLLSKYGPIIYLRFGTCPVLVVSSAAAVEDCFTKNDIIFANRPKSMAGDHFTYNYTVFAWAPYGDIWRCLRRFTVVEIFSTNNLKKSFPILEDEVHHLVHQLAVATHTAPACDDDGNRKKVELKTLFSILSVNFMMRIVAGKRFTEEGLSNMEVANKCLLEFKEIFFPSVVTNICDFFPILKLIGYKGIEKNFRRSQKLRDEYMQNLIDDIRLKKESNSSFKATSSKRNKSLIETLLSLQESEPEFYSDDVIKSIIVLMFVAGVETTAITLELAMSLLLSNPDEMLKVRLEIDNNVGNGRMLNESDVVANLPYLHCVINETLRLHPPAPLLLPHLSSENCMVGGYDIPQGTMLFVNAWAIHRDSEVWEEPNKFKPERFQAIHSERLGFNYIPFGMGRRACPGAAMAIRTVSFALGSLIQNFEWEKVGQEEDNMSQSNGLSLSKAEPLVAMCSPRKNMIGQLPLL